MKKILFVCTSNKDRSPALEQYFKETNPKHEYRSAGVNMYFCEKKGTHYITEKDIEWADIIIFAEDIHCWTTARIFHGFFREYDNMLILGNGENDKKFEKRVHILNCGEYEQGNVGEEYLTKAQLKLHFALE